MMPGSTAAARASLAAGPLGALVLAVALAVPAAAAPVAHRVAAPSVGAVTGVGAARPGVLDPGLPVVGVAQRVVVSGTSAGPVRAAVARVGGTVTADLPLVDGVAARVPAAALPALAASAGVTAVTADRVGRVSADSWDASTSASSFTRTTQATAAWARGDLGRGVGVAVLDTGVSPSPDLAGRLVQGPDLSGEGTVVDSYGHGTVMAGLVAGDGTESTGRSGGRWTGVAPAPTSSPSRSRAATAPPTSPPSCRRCTGSSAYRQHTASACSTCRGASPRPRPSRSTRSNHAVERLWDQGIVVVVAAGNSGPSDGTVTKPGDDPVVLTVGAYGDNGTTDPSDDVLPKWSSRGPTAQGLAKPDLVAPGRTVVGLRSHGSAIETDNPGADRVGLHPRLGHLPGRRGDLRCRRADARRAARPHPRPGQGPAHGHGVAAALGRAARRRARAGCSSTGARRRRRRRPRPAPARDRPRLARGQPRRRLRVTTTCDGVQREVRGEMDVRCQPWDRRAGRPAPGTAPPGAASPGRAAPGRRRLEGRLLVERDLDRDRLEGRHLDRRGVVRHDRLERRTRAPAAPGRASPGRTPRGPASPGRTPRGRAGSGPPRATRTSTSPPSGAAPRRPAASSPVSS